jgi:hypothetical protein
MDNIKEYIPWILTAALFILGYFKLAGKVVSVSKDTSDLLSAFSTAAEDKKITSEELADLKEHFTKLIDDLKAPQPPK